METSRNIQPGQQQTLIFSSEAPPAKPSVSQDFAKDLLTLEATSPLSFLASLHNIAPAGWSGRTSPAFCRTKQGLLEPSLEGWGNSGMGSPTVFLTLNTSEWPKDAAVCSLSRILEDTGNVPQRFYLSPKACAGILRRAAKRGKELPEPLAHALRAVAGLEPILSLGGGLSKTLRAQANSSHRADTMTFIPVTHALRAEGFDASEDGTGRETPLVATVLAHGQGNAEQVSDGEPSLTCNHEAPILFAPQAYRTTGNDGVYAQGDKTAALNCATDPNQNIITLAIRGRGDERNLETRTDGTANAVLTPNGGRDGIGCGAVAFKPAYFTRDNKTSGAPESECCHSLTSSSKAGDTAATIQTGMQVRRLTPRECERLQGFPDDTTKIKAKTADGPRYKSLGNSMAVPVMAWIGQRIDAVSKMQKGQP